MPSFVSSGLEWFLIPGVSRCQLRCKAPKRRLYLTLHGARLPQAGASQPGRTADGFFVRTISTTGVPRRQIVTGSPFSAALISSGSLFFASATLIFMSRL